VRCAWKQRESQAVEWIMGSVCRSAAVSRYAEYAIRDGLPIDRSSPWSMHFSFDMILGNSAHACIVSARHTFRTPTISCAQALTLTAGPGRADTDLTVSVSSSAATIAKRAMFA
jgi:hypothetical protein